MKEQALLDVRATHQDAALADLYDPNSTPLNPRRTHRVLDHAVDRLYWDTNFTSERERKKHLFILYEKMRAPLQLAAKRESQGGVREVPAKGKQI